MNRRTFFAGTAVSAALAASSVLLPNVVTACPPAKFNAGDLVEHKSGYRMFVHAGVYKNGSWLYDLGVGRDVVIQAVPENTLKKV